jgi:hypothetical protein
MIFRFSLQSAIADSWNQEVEVHLQAKPTVTDPTSMAASQAWINTSKKQLAALEKQRKEVTSKLDEVKKQIMAEEKAIAEPLTNAIAAVTNSQNQYLQRIAEEQWKAEQARREAEALITQTGNAVQQIVDTLKQKIEQWPTVEEAEKNLQTFKTWRPKCPEGLDAVLFADKFVAAKPALITYAEERLTALRTGSNAIIEAPEIEISVAAERMEQTIPPVEVVMKGVTKKLVPTVDAQRCDLVTLANLCRVNGYDVSADVLKWATKIVPGSQVQGITWTEETKITNKQY